MKQRKSSLSVATSLVAEPPPVSAGPIESTDSPAERPPSPHAIECEVQRCLQSHPALKFTNLHVHQCKEGICLEGFLESNEQEVDLCDVVRGVRGVTGVINHIVLTHP